MADNSLQFLIPKYLSQKLHNYRIFWRYRPLEIALNLPKSLSIFRNRSQSSEIANSTVPISRSPIVRLAILCFIGGIVVENAHGFVVEISFGIFDPVFIDERMI